MPCSASREKCVQAWKPQAPHGSLWYPAGPDLAPVLSLHFERGKKSVSTLSSSTSHGIIGGVVRPRSRQCPLPPCALLSCYPPLDCRFPAPLLPCPWLTGPATLQLALESKRMQILMLLDIGLVVLKAWPTKKKRYFRAQTVHTGIQTVDFDLQTVCFGAHCKNPTLTKARACGLSLRAAGIPSVVLHRVRAYLPLP